MTPVILGELIVNLDLVTHVEQDAYNYSALNNWVNRTSAPEGGCRLYFVDGTSIAIRDRDKAMYILGIIRRMAEDLWEKP